MVKQVPTGESFVLSGGTLARDGVDLEVNAYCRRANAKAVELAGADGEVVVFTMGPTAADDALREMIACGATRGVHICDAALAGSDTLVTSRVLGAAIHAEGPFDLVLCGLNSIDADTGQVPPQVAELLGVPFVAGARVLDVDLDGSALTILSETDSVSQRLRVTLPAVVSTAERLCDPSKATPDRRALVDADRIRMRSARDLKFRVSDVGLAGSPTKVGAPVVVEVDRARRRTTEVSEAVAWLERLGAFDHAAVAPSLEPVPSTVGGEEQVWVVLARPDGGNELIARAADVAAALGGTVTVLVSEQPGVDLGPWGADRVVVMTSDHADAFGETVADAAGREQPRVILVDGTVPGRGVASKVAARHGWGLTGDGIRIDVADGGALTVWKPALGGRMLAPITSTSPTQLATIRPGVLPERAPRRASARVSQWVCDCRSGSRIEVAESMPVDPGRAELAGAQVVIGVGQGVDPARYDDLAPLSSALGGVLGATRKVTDRGWMPRSRQIGITGSSLSPHLYVSIGASGRYNHACGFAAARVVLAINSDESAEIFDLADVGIVGDWTEIVPALHRALADRPVELRPASPTGRPGAN